MVVTLVISLLLQVLPLSDSLVRDCRKDTVVVCRDTVMVCRDTLMVCRDTLMAEPRDTVAARDTIRPVLGLSTNLLYDLTYIPHYGLTSIPSISLEYYPRRYGRFSFGLDVEWPMWRHWEEHRFFQIQNITLNARCYFSPRYRRPYYGPYVLANVNAGRYGIGWEEHGWQGEGLGASLGLGYKHSLFGSRRLFWDAGLAIGCFYSRYDPYVWGNDITGWYYYDYNGNPANFIRRNYALKWFFLPTRVWFAVGVDLFNRKKR